MVEAFLLEMEQFPFSWGYGPALIYIYHIFDHDIKNYIDIDMSIQNSYIHRHGHIHVLHNNDFVLK